MLPIVCRFVKYLPKPIQYFKKNVNVRTIHQTPHYFTAPPEPTDVEVIDVNIDTMMHEDSEFAANYNYEPPPQLITSTDMDGAPLAPVDVDPWTDEETAKLGTVDMEFVEEYKDEIKYPELPKERSGCYEFDGIKVWLPQKMLSPSTYRYRMEEGEEEDVPDDIRVCKFENLKTTADD